MTLARIHDKTAIDLLIQCLDHADSEIRWRSAMGLGRIPEPRVFDAIESRLRIESKSDVIKQLQSARERLSQKLPTYTPAG